MYPQHPNVPGSGRPSIPQKIDPYRFHLNPGASMKKQGLNFHASGGTPHFPNPTPTGTHFYNSAQSPPLYNPPMNLYHNNFKAGDYMTDAEFDAQYGEKEKFVVHFDITHSDFPTPNGFFNTNVTDLFIRLKDDDEIAKEKKRSNESSLHQFFDVIPCEEQGEAVVEKEIPAKVLNEETEATLSE